MTTNVDTIVIGGGMAGVPMALRAARHGPTLLIDGDKLGGTCLNRGCIPTKTMIHSAKVAHLARRAKDFGVHTGPVDIDMDAVVDRKTDVLTSIRDGSYRAVDKSADLTLIEEWARFVGLKTIDAGGETYQADRIVINNGALPHIPSIPGIDTVAYLDSTSALELRQVPEHLIVLGGGYVGCEFAQMYRRFGSNVTMVQRAERLLPAEDPDVSRVIEDVFKGEGIELFTSATIERLKPGNGGIVATVGDDEVAASHLLVSAGRTPNTASLDVEAAGIATDERGFIKAGTDYSTTAEGVYAIGDVIGPPMFTHTARDDAALLYRHLYRGEDITTASRIVPRAVFTDPEVATFGLSEEQARNQFGDDVAVGIDRFRGVARAKAIGETAGFVKIIVGPDRQILGATIVGPQAGDLIAELVVAAAGGLPVDIVRRAIHIHPTLAEAVNAAAGGVHRPATD